MTCTQRLLAVTLGFFFLTLNHIQCADLGVPSSRYCWPGGVIPYIMDSDVPRPERIHAAILEWASRTPIRLIPRTTEQNYVHFVRENKDGLCFSSIGMIGGEQKISTDDRCSIGTLVHEIGHAAGLWHEQSRRDRDRFVRVLYQNISPVSAPDFDRRMNDEPDLRPYDYASIMHYGAYTDSGDRRRPTIQTIPPGIPIGQRFGLSLGDIDAARHMYGTPPKNITIATHLLGLKVVVDGVSYITPRQFDWEPGSKHTIEAPESQIMGGRVYTFGRWNDDGQASHTIVASRNTTLYTANYIPAPLSWINIESMRSGPRLNRYTHAQAIGELSNSAGMWTTGETDVDADPSSCPHIRAKSRNLK